MSKKMALDLKVKSLIPGTIAIILLLLASPFTSATSILEQNMIKAYCFDFDKKDTLYHDDFEIMSLKETFAKQHHDVLYKTLFQYENQIAPEIRFVSIDTTIGERYEQVKDLVGENSLGVIGGGFVDSLVKTPYITGSIIGGAVGYIFGPTYIESPVGPLGPFGPIIGPPLSKGEVGGTLHDLLNPDEPQSGEKIPLPEELEDIRNEIEEELQRIQDLKDVTLEEWEKCKDEANEEAKEKKEQVREECDRKIREAGYVVCMGPMWWEFPPDYQKCDPVWYEYQKLVVKEILLLEKLSHLQ